MRLERFDFPGADGRRLAGRLDLPDVEPRGYALFAHCFSCGKDIRAAVRIARALAADGIATMRFDFTGLGESEGEFAGGISADVDDLVAAASHMRERWAAPLLLVGHSFGGTAALSAAARVPEVRAVVTLGAPFAPDHVLDHFRSRLGAIEEQGSTTVTLGGRPFTISRRFVEDVRMHDQAARIGEMDAALLVLHSPGDRIVSYDNARMIFEAAPEPRSLVALDGAAHLLADPHEADYAARIIAAWAERYVPRAQPSAVLPEEGEVLVEETGAGRFQQRVQAGAAVFLADEPPSVGGLGTGATPYDLLAAGLGACKAMTVRLYAERKELPLGPIRTRVRHAKVHAADCADCETREGRLDELTVELELPGPLSEEQRMRLLEIADKCPVHRTLESEVKVRTRVRAGNVEAA